MSGDPFDDMPPLEEPPGYADNWHFAREEGPHAKETTEAVAIKATPYVWRDPRTIPRREWLYGRHLIRRFLSTTVAPGAVGKSSLVLVEVLAMVTGRPLLGVTPTERLRVWYWNGEDPLEEIERRVAAICLHYGIEREEVEGWLFLDSGRTSEIVIATVSKDGAKIAVPVVEALEGTIAENRIDVVVIDPFVSSHRVPENDNGAVDLVAKAWNRMAENGNAAVELVHHVRKGQGGAGEFTVEDGRGAVALLAAARSARVLNLMSKDQAEQAGLDNPRGYFRADNGKANLAPPPDKSEWFHLVSVSLKNGPEGILDLADHVAVVEAWTWPDPFEAISTKDLRAAQAAVRDGGPWRENVQAREWVGRPIAYALKLDPENKQHRSKIVRMLKVWIQNEMFIVVEGKDEKFKPRAYVEVGKAASDHGD